MRGRRWVWPAGAAGLLIALAIWTFIRGGDEDLTTRVALLIVGSAAALAIGYAAGKWSQALVPATVLLVTATTLALSWAEIWRGDPLGGPFGYANASAAFLTQGVVAGAALSVLTSRNWVRAIAVAGLVLVGVAPLAGGSRVMVLLFPALFIAVLIGRTPQTRRLIATAAGAGLLIAIAMTAAIGAAGDDQAVRVPGLIDERRTGLWSDAMTIIADHPVDGAGAGSFRRLSPIARSDADAAWAHNEFLQYGAEWGLVGMTALIAVFASAFIALRGASMSPAVAPVSIGLLFLGLQSSIDYVLHFAAVPFIGAALVGSAIAGRPTRRESYAA